jgi:excisionase family DNA binding protein
LYYSIFRVNVKQKGENIRHFRKIGGKRTMTTERLTMNVSEACEKLGLSAPSLRKALKRGEIPHLRIGARILIPISALNKYLASAGKAD